MTAAQRQVERVRDPHTGRYVSTAPYTVTHLDREWCSDDNPDGARLAREWAARERATEVSEP